MQRSSSAAERAKGRTRERDARRPSEARKPQLYILWVVCDRVCALKSFNCKNRNQWLCQTHTIETKRFINSKAKRGAGLHPTTHADANTDQHSGNT